MKKSKKISIYILLIISIFIFNGQHVYATCSADIGGRTPTAGRYCEKMDYVGSAYNTDNTIVKYYQIPGYDIACELPEEVVKRRISNYTSGNKFFAHFKYTMVAESKGKCRYSVTTDASLKGKDELTIRYPNTKTIAEVLKYDSLIIYSNAKKVSDFYTGCFYNNKNSNYIWGQYGTGNGISYKKDIKQDIDCTAKKECAKCPYGYQTIYVGISKMESNCIKVDDSYCQAKNIGDIKEEVPAYYGDATNYCGITFMQLECKDDYVKNFQNKLNVVQNCGLDIDGSFGYKTAQCVMSFQKDNGLESNGVADSKTIDKLNSKYTELQTKNDDANLEYHKLIFNTNGGTFANGETTRTVWYLKDENTLSPATIPGKKGYKFLGWYNGIVKYTFGNKLTSDVTLTAKYEKSTTTKFCEDGDVLDIDNNQCIKVQDFADQDKNKFYIINNRLLTIQTKFIYTRNCSSDNKYTVTYEKAEGSNNSISCDTEKGYVRDTWRAEDTCQSDKTCPIKDGNNSCQRVYRGTCYASYDPGDTALGTEPDSDNTYNKDINNNATESPQTGGGIIALILVTLSIVGLAIYCYNVYNKKSEEV